ncbi:hypothetical protein RclHR1_02630014 [Rhizophagus clarus]|uniref:F-box domain-containing protein n=1 Tax=Rhizophagus clarus TaxID=94130 RepID=A0A2Z6RE72_9GLOM|nr:hypothetical protein RclHR1_02630014 [Rhizophagus clarus]GES80925.1 hypothetical protein GLOIN_2v1531010 [Rhizophagus clarus]
MFQLSIDCFKEIFECLEDDKSTLYSCILVNRFWCKVSVRILWRNVKNFNTSTFNALISYLPKESKEILDENGIIISNPTSEFPSFNYASFCKVLSIDEIYSEINVLLKSQPTILPQNLKNCTRIVVQEILKMYMDQVPSLRSLVFLNHQIKSLNLNLGAKDCLKHLTTLRCSSNISSDFLYQLSQICYNIQSLIIEFKRIISHRLADLISVQKNLKSIGIVLHYYLTIYDLTNIIPPLMSKLPDSLIKLDIYGGDRCISLSFMTNFINLQELQLSFNYNSFTNFENLQYTTFPQLEVLKIRRMCPSYKLLINFIENNGKNLKELYIGDFTGHSDSILNLAIGKFCPNLRKLSTGFKNDELETLKLVFENCRYLESIMIWCGEEYLNEKEAFETVMNYSLNIHELILYHRFHTQVELLPKELESLLVRWKNRIQRSLSLITIADDRGIDKNNENMEIIKKYIELGVLKKFKAINYDDYSFD